MQVEKSGAITQCLLHGAADRHGLQMRSDGYVSVAQAPWRESQDCLCVVLPCLGTEVLELPFYRERRVTEEDLTSSGVNGASI